MTRPVLPDMLVAAIEGNPIEVTQFDDKYPQHVIGRAMVRLLGYGIEVERPLTDYPHVHVGDRVTVTL